MSMQDVYLLHMRQSVGSGVAVVDRDEGMRNVQLEIFFWISQV